MPDRSEYKTFRPGDRVTVCRPVKSGKRPGVVLPGMCGVVDRMEQCVYVRFPEFPRTLWVLYDGDLILVSRLATIAAECRNLVSALEAEHDYRRHHMVHADSVDIEEMRSKLLTLDDVREKLSTTEPLTDVVFEAPQAQVRLEAGWAAAEDEAALANAWLRIDGTDDEIRLTKQAALEVGAFCRLPRGLQEDAPPDLVQTFVNRMMTENLARSKEMKLLVRSGDGIGTALTRNTIQPFSNLQFMDIMLEGIQAAYGEGEVLADYKFHHDLERTNLRLIVPGAQRVISGTRVADDTWSAGIQLRNSLAGTEQTAIDGYLFRWWCTNGCTDTLASVSALNRRQSPSPEDAYEWARESVNEILGGLESSFDAVQSTTGVTVDPDQVAAVMRDLYTEHSVPARSRERIINELADVGEDMTVYDVLNSVTVGANAPGTSPDAIEQLLTLGGHIAHAASTDRCGECRRILPGGFSAN